MKLKMQPWLALDATCVLVLDLCFAILGDGHSTDRKKLPICSIIDYSSIKDLILIASVDGKLSAIDAMSGKIIWVRQTERPGPLLTTSSKEIQLKSNGETYRMIPSLDGSVCRMADDATVESCSDLESFLRTPPRRADDTIIRGGKTWRTYAIQLTSGHLYYHCSTKHGCQQCESSSGVLDSALIIDRVTTTVRGIDNSGKELWNFTGASISVAFQVLLDEASQDQQGQNTNNTVIHPAESLVYWFDVDVGEISGVSEENGQQHWTKVVGSPIAGAWRIKGHVISAMDISPGNCSKVVFNKAENMETCLGCYNGITYIQQLQPHQHSLTRPNKDDRFQSRFRDDFMDKTLLGYGGFGIVVRARHRIDHKKYAVKRVDLPFRNEQERKKVLREVQCHADLVHENVVRYHQTWDEHPPADFDVNEGISGIESVDAPWKRTSDDQGSEDQGRRGYLYIQLEYCSKGTLEEWLQHRREKGVFPGEPKERLLRWFLDVARGVNYIHSKGRIHRDLKPFNIMMEEKNQLKVGDFGCIRAVASVHDDVLQRKSGDNAAEPANHAQVANQLSKYPGTALYMSPEQMKGEQDYDQSADIYSLGLILLELIYPMETENHEGRVLTALKFHDTAFEALRSFGPEFAQERLLLRRMLSHQPENRPSAQEVVDKVEQWLHQMQADNHHGSFAVSAITFIVGISTMMCICWTYCCN